MSFQNKKFIKKPSTSKTPVATATISNNMATVKFNRAANPLEPEFTFFIPRNAFCGDLHNDGADKPLHDLCKLKPSDVWKQTNYLFDNLAAIEAMEKKMKVGTLVTSATACHIEPDGTLIISTGTGKSSFAVHLCNKVEHTTIAETARKAVVFCWMDGTTLTVGGKYSKGKGEKQNG